jgi:hypothetical protein
MDNNSKKTLKNVVSETLIISSIPLIAYASTMAYEAGYNRHFDIPSELITISILRAVKFAENKSVIIPKF